MGPRKATHILAEAIPRFDVQYILGCCSPQDDTRMNDIGQCSACVHCRVIAARRSRFYFCERSATDPAFPRYPRLPVRVCVGFEAAGDDGVDRLTTPES
jgi:hypothetical protein